MKLAVVVAAIMVAFLFKDIIYEMYLKISNQEKPQEQQEKIVDDKPTTTVTDDKVETVGPEKTTIKACHLKSATSSITALKTADKAISRATLPSTRAGHFRPQRQR